MVQENPSYKGRGELTEKMHRQLTSSARCAIKMRSQEPGSSSLWHSLGIAAVMTAAIATEAARLWSYLNVTSEMASIYHCFGHHTTAAVLIGGSKGESGGFIFKHL